MAIGATLTGCLARARVCVRKFRNQRHVSATLRCHRNCFIAYWSSNGTSNDGKTPFIRQFLCAPLPRNFSGNFAQYEYFRSKEVDELMHAAIVASQQDIPEGSSTIILPAWSLR